MSEGPEGPKSGEVIQANQTQQVALDVLLCAAVPLIDRMAKCMVCSRLLNVDRTEWPIVTGALYVSD